MGGPIDAEVMTTTAASAVLELDDAVVRHAAVERRNGRRRLSCFGRRHLGFNVFDRAVRDGDADALSRVASLVANAFSDGHADRGVVVVHPPDVCSFFTPVSADVSEADRKRDVAHQVALLTGVRSLDELHLRVQTVRHDPSADGGPVDWLHILTVPAAAHDRVQRLLQGADVSSIDWMLSTEAASRTAAGLMRANDAAPDAYGLTVGMAPHHSEYALVRDGAWVHGHHALDVDTPQDRVYHVVALLNRLQVPLRAIDTLFAYGDAASEALGVFEAVFQAEVQELRPFQLIAEWNERVEPSAEREYAACIGAGL